MPRLSQSTDAQLLAAIPRMQPWSEASRNGRWALREAGKQILVYGGGELNLSQETGSFRLNIIHTRNGEVTADKIINAGSKVVLPDAKVVWLTKVTE